MERIWEWKGTKESGRQRRKQGKLAGGSYVHCNDATSRYKSILFRRKEEESGERKTMEAKKKQSYKDIEIRNKCFDRT